MRPGTHRGEHPARAGRVLVVVLAALALAACASPEEDAPERPPGVAAFAGSEPSRQRLGAVVWSALTQGDTATLERLRLSAPEHNDTIWPSMPASDAALGFPVDLAWLNIESRNRAALEEVLPRYAGSALDYAGVACDSAIAYDGFTIHSGCLVELEGGDTPGRLRLELFRHAVERDGGWKVIRYYDPED